MTNVEKAMSDLAALYSVAVKFEFNSNIEGRKAIALQYYECLKVLSPELDGMSDPGAKYSEWLDLLYRKAIERIEGREVLDGSISAAYRFLLERLEAKSPTQPF